MYPCTTWAQGLLGLYGKRPKFCLMIDASEFSTRQQGWIDKAWRRIDRRALLELDASLTDIASPTGEEGNLAGFLVKVMQEAGIGARYQPMDELRGNAIGSLAGAGQGPTLLLYAPIDTAFTGDESEDCPGLGRELPWDMRPQSTIRDGAVFGLGAQNPKGFVTCLVSAAAAIASAEIPLLGDLLLGLASGGMPTNRSANSGYMSGGHRSGCAFLLERGVRGDFAIIAKPGYAVSWEEAGLCWFEVLIKGALSYTGARQLGPYHSPIVDAAILVQELEKWFSEYSAQNTTELVTPQGAVGAISGGWKDMPAFTPATCTVQVDLRIAPGTDPMEAARTFSEALDEIKARHSQLDLEVTMTLALPGGRTQPSNWIVKSCIRAFELVEGRPHEPRTNTSGVDADVLRASGIPTARIGLPRTSPELLSEVSSSMNVCDAAGMERLTRILIAAIVDTCTRPLEQTVSASNQSMRNGN